MAEQINLFSKVVTASPDDRRQSSVYNVSLVVKNVGWTPEDIDRLVHEKLVKVLNDWFLEGGSNLKFSTGDLLFYNIRREP